MWDRTWLQARGFQGSRRFQDLATTDLRNVDGVYVICRESLARPSFLVVSPAGWFKGRDPTVAVASLEKRWVDGAHVVNIGKAAAGSSGRRGLKKRLGEYAAFGSGRPIGHQGGRYIWQLADSADLLVAWRTTPGEDPEDVEGGLIREFASHYGKPPFANLATPRRTVRRR